MLHARADYQGIQDWPHKRPHVTTSIGADEPVFLIRAKDLLSKSVMRDYLNRLSSLPDSLRDDKMIEALKTHIELTLAWQERNAHLIKFPDMPDGGAREEAPMPLTLLQVETIACVAHSANIGLQAFQAWEDNGIDVSPSWDELDDETKRSVQEGVVGIADGKTPEQSHQAWCDFKVAHGWVHGRVKDLKAKTHPCLVPYGDLPQSQRFKDSLFSSVVKTCLDAIRDNPSWPFDPMEGSQQVGPDNEYIDQQQHPEHPPTNPADGGLTNNEILDGGSADDEFEDFEDDAV